MRPCFFWVKFWTWPPWRTAVLAWCEYSGWTGRFLGPGGGIPVRHPLLELVSLWCLCGFSHVHSSYLAGARTKWKIERDLEFEGRKLLEFAESWRELGVRLQGGLEAFRFLLQFPLDMSKYFSHVYIFLIALLKSFIVQELFVIYIYKI